MNEAFLAFARFRECRGTEFAISILSFKLNLGSVKHKIGSDGYPVAVLNTG